MLLVADDFTVEERAVYANGYEGVRVGDFAFKRRFANDEVIHVRLNDENIGRVIDGVYGDYGKLIASAGGIYKRKNALRVVVEEPTAQAMDEATRERRKKLYEKDFRDWFTADSAGAALPLPMGLKLHDWSDNNRLQHTSRDMRALVDDIFDFTALAYRVPVRLLRGDVAELERAVDAFIMFAVKPLAELIRDEINAKMYTKKAFLERSYVKIDTGRIKMVDVVKYANAADKLFAIGVNSINDNLRLFDREPIDEPWSDARYTTKNYSKINVVAEGGEIDEDADDPTAV
jgi:HK97 family phage portal protein